MWTKTNRCRLICHICPPALTQLFLTLYLYQAHAHSDRHMEIESHVFASSFRTQAGTCKFRSPSSLLRLSLPPQIWNEKQQQQGGSHDAIGMHGVAHLPAHGSTRALLWRWYRKLPWQTFTELARH